MNEKMKHQKEYEAFEKAVDELYDENEIHAPKCPHCNGLLMQIFFSPIHFAVGSKRLVCTKCERQYKLAWKRKKWKPLIQ